MRPPNAPDYGPQAPDCPALNRIQLHAVVTAGSNSYCYDQNGNMSRRTVDANTYTLSYDAENRLTGVSGPAVASYVYDGDGQRVQATFGSGDSASITSYLGRQVEISPAYREDFSDGLAQGWTAASGTWTVIGGGYRQSGAGSNTNAYRSQVQNQLLVYQWRATFTSGTSAGLYLFASTALGTQRGNSYRIWQDATHVRIYESANNVATLRASFIAANAAGQTHSYQTSYDPLTGKLQVWRDNLFLGSWTDATPLLSGSYLALRTDGANVLFDDLVVSEMVKYYESSGQRVALRKNGVVSYLFGDHLGSTSVTANASGTRTGELWYKPWGESRGTPVGTTPTTYRYTGQREDAYINLYWMGSRAYDPSLGRFISPDSIVPNPSDPQSLTRYSFAANNPLRWVDPTGHAPQNPNDADDNPAPCSTDWCWQNRWYRAHGYRWTDRTETWTVDAEAHFYDPQILIDLLLEAGVSIASSWDFGELSLVGMGIADFAKKVGGTAKLRGLMAPNGASVSRQHTGCNGVAPACAIHNAITFYDPFFRDSRETQKSVVVHEFGHVIDYAYWVVNGSYLSEMFYNHSIGSGAISDYASVNHGEYWAEGVGDWIHGLGSYRLDESGRTTVYAPGNELQVSFLNWALIR